MFEFNAEEIFDFVGEFTGLVAGIYKVDLAMELNEEMEWAAAAITKNGFPGDNPGVEVPSISPPSSGEENDTYEWYGWPGAPGIIPATAEGVGGSGFSVQPWLEAPDDQYLFILEEDDRLSMAGNHDDGATVQQSRVAMNLYYHVLEA